MRKTTLSEFLEGFGIPLRYRQPESPYKSWVFWSQYEGSLNASSPAAVLGTGVVQERLRHAFSNLVGKRGLIICQFWAPVKMGGRRLLSCSDLPFVVSDLSEEVAKYRLHSAKYLYNIDVNKFNIEQDPMIRSGGPATVFLNRLPCMEDLVGSPFESSPSRNRWAFSIMLPVCFPSQSSCIGVLECSGDCWCHDLGSFVLDMKMVLKEAGLDVCSVEQLIPYEIVNGLRLAKNKIEEALRIVCASHNLILAQVWIASEGKNHMPFSFSLENMKQMAVIKFTGYFNDQHPEGEFGDFGKYYSLCDVIRQQTVEELALKTLQDYEARYISKLPIDMLIDWEKDYSKCCAFTICLRSIDTGDFDYAFEFIWLNHSNFVILLEAILLTLKRCLPRFKFSSGAEIGYKLDVIDVDGSKDGETSNFKLFQGKRLSPLPKSSEKGQKPLVVDHAAPSKMTCKTTTKVLPREVIEEQFGKQMKEAAKNLNVSLSTFKRKCKQVGIPEWPGPNFVKRNTNDSLNTNEEDNGAIQDTSTANLNTNTQTIKAHHVDDISHLPVSKETFVGDNVKKILGKRLSAIPTALEQRKKPIYYIAPSKVTHKTAPKVLSREVIEKQFGKTMKEAAKDLDVSLSTLKRKLKSHGIYVWPGPNAQNRTESDLADNQIHTNEENSEAVHVPSTSTVNINKDTQPIILGREEIREQFGRTMKEAAENLEVSLSTLKRKCKGFGGPKSLNRSITGLSNNQTYTNEDNSGAIQVQSTVNKNVNKNILTIKAEYLDDMFKFHLPVSQTTFVAFEKEISTKLKLSLGTYKLKYLDEDGDWISLTSDEELTDCIESSRKSYRTVVRLRVLPSTQSISSPSSIPCILS